MVYQWRWPSCKRCPRRKFAYGISELHPTRRPDFACKVAALHTRIITVVCYTAKTIKNRNKKRATNKIGRIGEHMTGNESQVTQNGSQRPHSIDLENSIIFLSGK